MGAPWGGPGAPWAPGAPNPMLWVPHKFENLPEICILAFLESKMDEKKLGFRPRDPHGEIWAGILRRILVSRSKIVGWRPIWWQNGVI